MEILIGTYTESLPHVDGKADGIYAARYDASSGEISDLQLAGVLRNPSWVTSRGSFIYTVIETTEFESKPGGGVAALRLGQVGAPLTELSTRGSRGVEPAHLEVDPSGRWLVVSNYRDGSIASFPIREDGSIGHVAHEVHHEGSSIRADRQAGPHAHQVVFGGPRNRMFVPDLGLDLVKAYSLDVETGRMAEIQAETIACRPGSGPRHMVFHPENRYAFTINELDNTVSAFLQVGDHGWTEVAYTSTLPEGFIGHNQTAALRIDRTDSILYASNRGHDSVAVIDFNKNEQTIALRETVATRGLEPRDIVLAPDGRFLLAANQNSDAITTFAVDDVGGLRFTGELLSVPTPVCLTFVEGR